MKLRWIGPAAAITVGAVAAADYAWQLATHGVPVLINVACTLAIYATVHTAVRRAVDELLATTHRCPVPGCRFRIRLVNPDPGESRRWQEIAAAHPLHRHH
ncbi:hypothetical protein LE181_17870 [Streptomyces sp. SCA3-4]|uniref:Uncharacterized protein n=1 Tax=Streptomyces cinnamoneus TaxID=53446 RepID=A0A918TAN3_STRCJ|nr:MULTISPECIES: hypothetical protein [Streptomyces]MCA6094020.1 hypothetical protein [Streptomyces sichuanensis]GHC33129.1 hypothetical protein GCM10010507_01880 [Streptomyces cinnamoneus]